MMLDESQFAEILTQLLPTPLPRRLAVAVSGGSDSLCLTWLAQRFCKAHNLDLYPLIINHGLRAEETDEVTLTAQWMRQWGLTPHVLTWPAERPTSAIQEKARQGRYLLLVMACHAHGISHLLVGHQQDEVLETVLMRKAMHSQWRGLAGLSAITYRHGIHIVRPLLTVPKSTLREMLEGHPFIEDPGNCDPRYTRTHMRQLMASFSPRERQDLWDEIQGYACRRQEEAIRLQPALQLFPEGYGRVTGEAFRAISPEVGPWILGHWVRSISYGVSPLRPQKLEAAWKRLAESFNRTGMVLTLGGCYFVQREALYIFREWARLDPQRAMTSALSSPLGVFLWDYRFLCQGEVPVQPLDPQGMQTLPWVKRHSYASWPQDPWQAQYVPCILPYPVFHAPGKFFTTLSNQRRLT